NGLPLGSIGSKIADTIGIGQYSIMNLYQFFESKNNTWRIVGSGYTPSLIPFPTGGVYKDPDEIYFFPLNYNDRDSSTFDVSTPLGNQFLKIGYIRQFGYRITKAEGWGTISTPYAQNIACLKIKSEIYETDSVLVTTPPLNAGITLKRVEYKWLSK